MKYLYLLWILVVTTGCGSPLDEDYLCQGMPPVCAKQYIIDKPWFQEFANSCRCEMRILNTKILPRWEYGPIWNNNQNLWYIYEKNVYCNDNPAPIGCRVKKGRHNLMYTEGYISTCGHELFHVWSNEHMFDEDDAANGAKRYHAFGKSDKYHLHPIWKSINNDNNYKECYKDENPEWLH